MWLLCKRLLHGPSDTNNAKVHRVSHCHIQAKKMQYVLQGQVLYTSLHIFVTYRSRFVFDFETVLLSTFICMHELGLVVRNWRV